MHTRHIRRESGHGIGRLSQPDMCTPQCDIAYGDDYADDFNDYDGAGDFGDYEGDDGFIGDGDADIEPVGDGEPDDLDGFGDGQMHIFSDYSAPEPKSNELKAGKEFDFKYTLKNTHTSKAAKNIKITVEQADGVFIPVAGSNMGQEKIKAVDGVSFTVEEGEFCCLLGTSGSGKSTLLNLMAGIEKLTKGEIIIKGKSIGKMNENKLAKFRQDNLGFVFQSYNLIGSMTALENVEFPLVFKRVPAKKRRKLAVEMLKNVGLKGRMQHKPKEMSGGQQQRVGIARAFVARENISRIWIKTAVWRIL